MQTFSGKRQLAKLYFEFVSPKTGLKVLLNNYSSRFITKGVEKKRISGQLLGVRAVFAARGDPLDQGETSLPGYPSILTEKKRKKNSIRVYKMVDESVIGYSADGKDHPIASHPCTYVARQVFSFFFFLRFCLIGLNMRPQVVF